MADASAATAVPTFPYEFDPDTRARASAYEREGRVLSVVGGTGVPLALGVALFFSGASAHLADAARGRFPHSALAADVTYILAVVALFAVASLPLRFYTGHARERRFGMTRRTARSFMAEAAKGVAGAAIVALVLLLPFLWLARHADPWWAPAAGLYAAFSLLAAAIIPHLVLPLFYKVQPLADGPLRDAVLDAASRAGLPGVPSIAVLRESTRSPRANAFVHGLGRTRRIVLYDTLVTSFHPREVAFTVAHELGHLKHHDVPRSLLLAVALIGPELFLLSLFLAAAAPLGGASGAGDVAAVPLLLVFAIAVGTVTGPFSAWLHRRSEARADAFALRATGDGAAAASMLRRICDLNLLDDSPSPLVERLLNSHPSPRRRIDAALASTSGQPGAASP